MSSNWPIARLEDLCSIDTGKSDTKDAIVDGAYPFFDRSRIVKRSNRYLFDAHALIIPGEGAEFLPKQFEGKFDLHQRAYALHGISDSLDIRFLYHYLHHVKDYFPKVAVGATVKSLRRRHFADLEIPVPPLDEQKRIVAKLDQALGHVDSLIESINMRADLTQKLLGKTLGLFLDSEVDSEVVPLSEMATMKGRIGWRGLTAKEYTDSGPYFLSVHSLNHGHVVDFSQAFHISEERYLESPEIMLQADDVLICKDGAGIGKVGIVTELPGPSTVNSSLLVIRANDDVIPRFLYFYLLGPKFQEVIQTRLSGSTTPHLYQRDIAELPVRKLSIDRQRDLLKKLDVIAETMELAPRVHNRLLSEAQSLRQSILSAAFAGDL